VGAGQLAEEAGDQGRSLKVRAFFGLPLPEEHRAAYASALLGAPALAPRWRWTRVENLHLTVRFLGHVELATADRIAGRVEASAPRAFALQLGGLDAFKRGRLASVLWVGLQLGVEEVTALATVVEAECAREGLEAERRPYRPHMTLARAREREGAPVPHLKVPELPPWRAGELVLFRSQLGRSGPVYEPLRSISLR
jgi:RNA 2',3'-cyclic 3'-phosphodiesterase